MSDDQHNTDRKVDAERLRAAYGEVIDALTKSGKILRTSSISGYFGWVAPQKTAIAGLKALIAKLKDDVPRY